MSYKGTVKNGVVVLPPQVKLPEGTAVEVTPLEARAGDPPFLRAILKPARPRDWPEDFALIHTHYAASRLEAPRGVEHSVPCHGIVR